LTRKESYVLAAFSLQNRKVADYISIRRIRPGAK